MEDVIVQLIKQKKELATLDDTYVLEKVKKYIQNNNIKVPTNLTEKQFPKNKVVKQVVTDVRAQLRTVYGVFIRNDERTLTSHQSSFERQNYYEEIYEKIFERVEVPEYYTLLDLACGYNPLSYNLLPEHLEHCTVSDLSSEDMEFLQNYFDKENIPGEAHAYDLLTEEAITWVEQQTVDITFLFKALDSLETVKRHSSKLLLSKLNTKYIVVSFPKVSIGGRNQIGEGTRNWFEHFCNKEGWPFDTFEVENELFYIVKKV